jgi:hypothetical protein
LWLSYLFVLFYLGIAAGAVSHADLLLKNPVKLPFLSIELPLLVFFSLAPVLFVITHAYTLVNLALLADRVREFHKELGDQLAADPSLQPRAPKIRSIWARQLPSNIFVQFLGGPNEIHKGGLGQILEAILSVTLVSAQSPSCCCKFGFFPTIVGGRPGSIGSLLLSISACSGGSAARSVGLAPMFRKRALGGCGCGR